MIIYIAYVNRSYGHVSNTLHNLNSIYFPAQMEVFSALHNVEMIERNFQLSITTGDVTPVEENESLVRAFTSSIERLKAIDESIIESAAEINDIFFTYYNGAKSLAEHLATNSVMDSGFTMIGISSHNNHTKLVEELQDLYNDQELMFNSSIENSYSILYRTNGLGYALGFLISLAMSLLGIFIANSVFNRIDKMVRSLKKIASGSGGMEQRISIEGRDEMSELAHWFNTFLDKLKQVTDESTARIKEMAYTDQLSGLANRRKLILNLEEYVQQNNDNPDSHVAVYYFDLDNFKPINDNYGHDAGDALIQMVSTRLLETFHGTERTDYNLTENPLLANHPLIARIGGDEFVVVHPFNGSALVIDETKRLLKEVVTRPYMVFDHKCQIGMSGGISFYPEHSRNSEDLITYADVAMLATKRDKKSNISVFIPEMIERSVDEAQVTNAMHNSINNNELLLEFQPKYNLRTHEIEGAEALIRWEQAEMGTVSPAIFIPLAETTGFIYEIDRWVLEATASQIKQWEEDYGHAITVSINISAIQASNDNLPDLISGILEQYQLHPDLIEIEITETAALRNMEVLVSNIEALRKIGVSVALDDFGAGNSSLILLQNTAIDTLKLDRSLLTEIGSNDKQYVIVSSIINIARSLGIKIVAEGIETVAQEERLMSLSCYHGQGFIFSAPMTPDSFAAKYLANTDRNLKCA